MDAVYHPLTVRVVGPDGPRAGAVVCIVRSPMVLPEVGRRTDAAGECRLGLSAGVYTFEAYSGGGAERARADVRVPGPAVLELTLGPKT